ncbi:MAG: ATP-binding protein [Bacteroidales bacterium]|nr:ATP-binding protein [Bacteroidales bacterium]
MSFDNDHSDNFRNAKLVLAAHKIALWEYDLILDKIVFSEDYFQVLELDKAGIFFETVEQSFEFVHPVDREGLTLDVFRSRLLDRDEKNSLCLRFAANGGKTVWLESRFFSVRERDPDGNPLKLMFYTENVTDRCESEQKIRRLEERNRKVIQALPEFIFIFDDNFFIRDVMMSEGTVLLHPTETLIGIDGRTVYSPEVSDLFLRNIRECLKDGQLREIEYPLDMKGQGRFYFQARIAPFEDNTVLALIHDIGDRMQRSAELLEAKRKAEESDKMKSLFLANMSHEIRTPLNAVVGFSEILLTTDDPAEKAEYVDIIQKNSNLLLQLISDVLDLSRIESGKSETNIQPTEMSALIDEVGKVHQLKMPEHVDLYIESPAKKIWTLTDRNRVMQILFNFLSNAIKNTGKGSITLGMAEDGEWLRLYVKDTGRGISPDQLTKIFGRFEKLDEFVSGTGLGLSICQALADRLEGRIEVESTLGKGSTFTFIIPYRFVKPDTPSKNEWHLVEPEKSGKKILVAEDMESAFIQINTSLNKKHTVSWARNGQEAVNSFQREPFDLVLMDIRMPVMNGVEAIKRIRAISPHVPIVAVTAFQFRTEQQQALAAGCNEVLVKPFTIEQIENCANKYLFSGDAGSEA